MRDFKTGTCQMILAMIISGSIGAFVLLSGLAVIDVVFWRCVIGAAALMAFIHFSKTPFSRFTLRQLLLAAGGGVALVINWLLLFAAYTDISMGMATVVYNTQPFMLVLMGIALGERVGLLKWGWLLLAFAGVIILLSSDLHTGGKGHLASGIMLALGAAFFYALTAIITRHLKAFPPRQIALIQCLTGIVMLLPLAHLAPTGAPQPWGILLTLGIVHTGIMYQLLYSAIQKLPTPVIGSLSFIYPLVALLVDALVFGHTMTLAQAAGGILILLSAAGNNLGWGTKKEAPQMRGPGSA